ncbi:MAG: site-specific DNA-methyltransferase [Synergistaceae bacterium]|nr:site-specific DNA-methyltransferase [Synergistaceae bacterium]
MIELDTLIHGDSIEILKTFPENFVHAIISDIPYGIGCDDWDILHNNTNSAYGGSSPAQVSGGGLFRRRGKPLNGWSEADKNIPREYQAWCESWAGSWLRVLKPGGTCFIFAGRRYAHRCIAALEDAGFTFRDMLAWEKNSAPHRAQRLSAIYERRGDSQNASNWEGWRVGNLRPLFEPILWFQKPYRTGGTIADNVMNHGVGAWNESAMSKYNSHDDICSNIIRVQVTQNDSGLHIAQKPLKLMELLIALVTLEGQIVLDPFMGSGTTCLAAKITGRHYIGIDIDTSNVNTARERLNSPGQFELVYQNGARRFPLP